MSPRNDTFLSLCLAQAELSPLHYRHGSIIVRGGKVIGQGFNSYHPGNGGALKTGILPSSSLDGPAIAELKQRLKSKPKHRSKHNQQDAGTFTPFESIGDGHNANMLLSLHSEMMAIQSALSLSSGTLSSQTSARATKSWQKPCFSLSGDSKKRKARARALKAYVEAVCAEAAASGTGKASGGKFSIQKQGFEPDTSQPGFQVQQRQCQRQGGQRVSRGSVVECVERYRETPEEDGRERVSVWASAEALYVYFRSLFAPTRMPHDS
jgi:deoxycytidylate deaminase